jgi:hypothetical protein
MPIYKWDNLLVRLVAFEVKHATSTNSRGMSQLKTRDGINPKFNLTSWAAKYNIIFPRPSIFVNFLKEEKTGGRKIFNFAGFLVFEMQ